MKPSGRVEKAHFIAYSNNAEPFFTNARNYCESALRVGFDSATHYTEDTLRQTEFWRENAAILEQPRGAGYWLWKPFIILDMLRKVGPNDIVVYNDAGRYTPGSFEPFPRFPTAAIELTALTRNGFLHGFVSEWMIQGHYTKRDCFVLMDADTEAMHSLPQVSAVPLFYMPTSESFAFLEEWLEYARDPRILTDQPDELGSVLPQFIDHRHDQSISSILVHKKRAHYCDFSKSGGNKHVEEIRRRNPHVPRIGTHAGYVSLMIERALPDDFFVREAPDPNLAAGILCNLRPDEELPVRENVFSHALLMHQIQSMMVEGTPAINQNHLRAILSPNRVSSSKLHALSKTENTDDFWRHAIHSVNDAVSRHLNDNTELSDQVLLTLSVEALRSAESAYPEIHREVLLKYLWSCFDNEARALFKTNFKNFKTKPGKEAMQRFLETIGQNKVIPLEVELSGQHSDLAKDISQRLKTWAV